MIRGDRPVRFCAVGDSRTQNSSGLGGQWADAVAQANDWRRVGNFSAAYAGTLLTNIDSQVWNLTDNWRWRAAAWHADVYIILDGINDLLHTNTGNTLLTRATWGAQLGTLLENLVTLPWRPLVYFLGTTPLYNNALNFAYPFGSSWNDCFLQFDTESYNQCILHGANFIGLVTGGFPNSLVLNTATMPSSYFRDDGIHPNATGQSYIAGVVQGALP